MFPSRSEIQKLSSELRSEEILDFYYEAYKNLPKQGSDEWARDRKIGGSSVAPILGIEKFSTKKKVAKSLLSSSSFSLCEKEGAKKEDIEGVKKEKKPKSEIAMNWGTVFEEAAKIYLSRFIKIYEFGSLPGFEINGQTVTSYSPDGIFIMTDELMEAFSSSSFAPFSVTPFSVEDRKEEKEEKEKKTLLEIKCPFMRKITGEVPDYYLPQMQLGMHTIGFVEQALYCEFSFRICSLSDLNFSSSCSSFTNNGIYDTPKAIGFFGFVFDENFKTNIIPLFSAEGRKEKSEKGEIGHELREIESIYKNISEIEKFAYLQKFCNNEDLSEIFRVNYPKFDGIDFGGSTNFLYKTTDLSDEGLMALAKKKIREGDYFASEQLYDSNISLWDCRAFFAKQLKLFEMHSLSSSSFLPSTKKECEKEKKENIGIICYKLFQVEANIIEKKPFERELETILKFAAQVEEIKKKPQQEHKSCLNSL